MSVFALSFLGPAVLTPWIYQAVTTLIGPVPFHSVFDRLVLIFALLALVLFRREFLVQLWWPLNRFVWGWIGAGLLLALISADVILAMGLLIPSMGLTFGLSPLTWERIGLALLAASLVPALEETLFRGFLLTQLNRVLPVPAAIVWSALLFSTVHFIKVSTGLDAVVRTHGFHITDGFVALASAGTPVVDGAIFSIRGANLVIIGLLLGTLAVRCGHLWLVYGLHAGWILAFFLLPSVLHPKGFDLLNSDLTTGGLLILGGALWMNRALFSPQPEEPFASGDDAP